MVMPLAGRAVAAVIGGLLVLTAASSVIGTLVVTRSIGSRLTWWADRTVDRAYQLVVSRSADSRRRDQLLATEAAAVLLGQLVAWLAVAYVGYALLLWPFAVRGVLSAFVDAGAMGFDIPDEPDPDAGITLTYAEFLDAVARMREVDFPIELDPAEAWPEFVGWRVNYEPAAYAVGAAVYAVPALWSGPRRHPVAPIAPIRPDLGRPPR